MAKSHVVKLATAGPVVITDPATGHSRTFDHDDDRMVMASRADADLLLANVPGATAADPEPDTETPPPASRATAKTATAGK